MMLLTCLCVCAHVQGNVAGTDSDASLTAFCLIAMQESQSLCYSAVEVRTLHSYSLALFLKSFRISLTGTVTLPVFLATPLSMCSAIVALHF